MSKFSQRFVQEWKPGTAEIAKRHGGNFVTGYPSETSAFLETVVLTVRAALTGAGLRKLSLEKR